jgi:hypothetical protein
MIFQTAVRKFVDMHEKKLKWVFYHFLHIFRKQDQKKILTKNA